MSRWTSAAVVLIGCSTARAPVDAPSASPPRADALEFTADPGSAPPGQVLPVVLREAGAAPVVRVDHAGPDRWLAAGVAGAGARRILSVQPLSHRLGPGVYHATVHVEGGAATPAEVAVRLTVLGHSHTSCPAGSTLRYTGGGDGAREPADFGKTFFARYCTACHASTVRGAARLGAPRDLDWDSADAIRANRQWIDAVAAAELDEARGDVLPPLVMPPAFMRVRPSQAERDLLARWIACGAP